MAALAEAGARSVIDLGCGPGKLIARLLECKAFSCVACMDASTRAVESARELVKKRFPLAACEIFVSSLTYRDGRIKGYDAAVLSEVIEHFEPERMDLVMRHLLRDAAPKILLITTPNREYNTVWAGMPAAELRHPDHRYEFSEQEFAEF